MPAHEAQSPWIVGDSEGGSVADFEPPGPWMTAAEATANACLGAAAPQLLAAAKRALPARVCLTNTHIPDSAEIPLVATMGDLRQIAAAIAKAEGRS